MSGRAMARERVERGEGRGRGGGDGRGSGEKRGGKERVKGRVEGRMVGKVGRRAPSISQYKVTFVDLQCSCLCNVLLTVPRYHR
jgi:hypothetical protein